MRDRHFNNSVRDFVAPDASVNWNIVERRAESPGLS